MTELYTLYGAQISNYTAKVRSYLIFKKLLFQEVVATNYIYDKILVPVVGFRMMPVIRMEFGRMYEPTRKLRRPDQDWREKLGLGQRAIAVTWRNETHDGAISGIDACVTCLARRSFRAVSFPSRCPPPYSGFRVHGPALRSLLSGPLLILCHV